MTRFEMNLRGLNGEFWQKDANKELDRIEKELEEGKITIDDNGVARNCIGRIVTDEVAEKLHYVTCRINIEATTKAREEADREFFANYKPHKPSREELLEMRYTFGEGTTVVNVFTGERITV